MSFTPRGYDAIVRDLLTTLTGGTVHEAVVVPDTGPTVLDRLAERPFRRVSHLEGVVAVGDSEIPYRFTSADFELVAADDGDGFTALRFRDEARAPVPGSTLLVNYYPVQTLPTPLTDVNVGSVVRTLLESVGRELAQVEQELRLVYDSAFLDTAEGSSLDRVTALVGIRRLPTGVPMAQVRFSRDPGALGRVTVPTGTVVTDADGNRYATVADLVLEPGETSRQVLCAGTRPDTAPVDAGALDRLEILVAGISGVTNEAPATRAAGPEADADLRRRARNALAVTARGTIGALEFGLRSIPGIKDVVVVEEPNGVPGEVRLDVAWDTPPDADQQAEYARRLAELRPAGIRIIEGEARRRLVKVSVALTLAGTGTTGSELADLQDDVATRIADQLATVATGGTVRGSQLVRAVLDDARIVDATVELIPTGEPGDGAPVTSLQLATGEVLELVPPVAFARVTAERTPTGPALRSDVDVLLPVHLVVGVTEAEARSAIQLALESHLAGRDSAHPLTVDGIATAIRDDTRYALVRELAVATVENADRFSQLTDGAGTYTPAPGEILALRSLETPVQEGGA